MLLGATTTFPAVLRALEALRVPRLFVLIAAFMYRYLFVIVEEVRRMRAALSSRGYRPRHALQAAAIGRVASALFLRTYARGERVYLAMQARGYRGDDAPAAPLVFGRADAAFVALVLLALVPLRVSRRELRDPRQRAALRLPERAGGAARRRPARRARRARRACSGRTAPARRR